MTRRKEQRWVWVITRQTGFSEEIVHVCDSEEKSDEYFDKHPKWELLVDECEIH